MKSSKTRLISILFFVVTLAAIYYVASKRPPSADVPETFTQALSFDSMDEYIAHSVDPKQKVVFIGLDGATWDVLDPMIDEGLLPTLARLKREGAWGDLESVDCYFSPPAWTSMMTGFSPENTGIYTFGQWIDSRKEFKAVSSLDVEVPHVWDIASRAGRKVAVTNVPLTYPASDVNGIMVSGLMTPIVYDQSRSNLKLNFKPITTPFDRELDSKAHGGRMVASTIISTNKLFFALYDTTDDGEDTFDTVALKIFPTVDQRRMSDEAPLYTFPLGSFSPWVQMSYRKRTDRGRQTKDVACAFKLLEPVRENRPYRLHMTPYLRVPSDPELHLTFPRSLGDEIDSQFGYYLITMTYREDLISPGTHATAEFASFFYDYDDWDLFFYVFQAPDNAHHVDGIGETARDAYQTIDRFLASLIERLPEDATLILASDHGFDEYDSILGLNEFFDQLDLVRPSAAFIDHKQTLVFHNQWCLYFNEDLLTADELESRGVPIAAGQSPRDALKDFLKTACGKLTHEGEPIPVELIDVPEDATGNPPDLIVKGSYDGYFVEGADLTIQSHNDVTRKTRGRTRWFHDPDGMYLFWGKSIEKSTGDERRIEDITPTILYLLGLPLSREFDGRVISDVVRSDFRSSRPLYYIGDYGDQDPAREYTVEELESLEEKLRSLGYIQ